MQGELGLSKRIICRGQQGGRQEQQRGPWGHARVCDDRLEVHPEVSISWVAVKTLKLSFHNPENILFTICNVHHMNHMAILAKLVNSNPVNGEPQDRPQYTMIRIIGTPKKGPLI